MYRVLCLSVEHRFWDLDAVTASAVAVTEVVALVTILAAVVAIAPEIMTKQRGKILNVCLKRRDYIEINYLELESQQYCTSSSSSMKTHWQLRSSSSHCSITSSSEDEDEDDEDPESSSSLFIMQLRFRSSQRLQSRSSSSSHFWQHLLPRHLLILREKREEDYRNCRLYRVG